MLINLRGGIGSSLGQFRLPKSNPQERGYVTVKSSRNTCLGPHLEHVLILLWLLGLVANRGCRFEDSDVVLDTSGSSLVTVISSFFGNDATVAVFGVVVSPTSMLIYPLVASHL